MARSEQRKDGWPEQEPVRQAFREYLSQFKSDKAAAQKIGVTKQQVSDWKRGTGSIPEWFCEHLGFRKAYIPIGGPVGVTITGKSPCEHILQLESVRMADGEHTVCVDCGDVLDVRPA